MREQNNYKQNLTFRKMKKRGQVAIFVVVAVLIAVAGVLVYLFVPNARNVFSGEVVPSTFIRECVEEEVRAGVDMLSKQGGYSDPEGFILYKGMEVKYLCYTSQYYLPCKVQQPLIKRNFERELESLIEFKTDECVQKLRSEYEGRGFEVSGVEDSAANVEIIPGRIRIVVDAPMSVSNAEGTQSFRSFNVEMESEIYDLLLVATSIIDFESTYGDTETSLYYQYYPNLQIEKSKLGDGTTVYGVRDVTTDEKFYFASRSLAWPGGYGLDA